MRVIWEIGVPKSRPINRPPINFLIIKVGQLVSALPSLKNN